MNVNHNIWQFAIVVPYTWLYGIKARSSCLVAINVWAFIKNWDTFHILQLIKNEKKMKMKFLINEKLPLRRRRNLTPSLRGRRTPG